MKFFVFQSEEFPLTVDVLLDILEIVAPFKHLEKLRRFCEVRLPPGFPVRVGRCFSSFFNLPKNF